MGYSRDVYKSASEKLARRRMDAEVKAAALREEVVSKHPEVAEIEQKMSQSAIKIARAVLKGSNLNSPSAETSDIDRKAETDRMVEQIKNENLALQSRLADILAGEGIFSPNFQPVYSCKKCSDTGYTQSEVCSCLDMLLREEAFAKISYFGNMENSDFGTINLDFYPDEKSENDKSGLTARERMSEVVNFCKKYAYDISGKSVSLLFTGPTGIGKTHISLAIAKEAIFRGMGVIYGPIQVLLHQVEKERFGKAGNSDENTEDNMIKCDLLILDDLGTEFSSSLYNSCLYNILNSRILEGKPTIISTNLNQRELFERYGEQITSRILGTFTPIRFFGKDIRQIKLRNRIN